MSNNNKISTKLEIAITKTEEYIKMKLDEQKDETSISIDMKLLTLNSKKSTSSHDQPSADLINWPLLKSPEKIPMHHNSPNI